jgi:predicted aspartyl protease
MANVSELPLQRQGRHVIVEAKINGQPARMIFDTGTFTSILTPQAVSRLHLKTERSMAGELHGIGGSQSADLVTAKTVELGQTHGRNFPFLSADLGPTENTFGADGLLSSDLLSKWDIDLDFQAGRIGLFQPIGDCRHPAAYLNGPLYRVDLLPFGEDHTPRIKIVIDGKTFTALVDTGAFSTSIYRHAAARLGIHVADLPADPHGGIYGVGPRKIRSVTHVFQPITIGDLTVENMPVDIIDQASDDDVDMLLGADFQARLHLWISYSSGSLIMQYPPTPSPPLPAAEPAGRPS